MLKATLARVLARFSPAGYEAAREAYRYFRFVVRRPHESDFLLFRKLRNEAGLFVDGGANVGQSALSFACANRSFRIHSFEANPLLDRQLARVGRVLGERFTYSLCALGETNRAATLFVPVVGGIAVTGEATLAPERLERPHIRQRLGGAFEIAPVPVHIKTLDEFRLSPDILKLDVQGSELQVLRGARETISRCRPLLLIEVNDYTRAIMDYLSRLGYQFYRYEPGPGRLVPWCEELPSLNFVAIHPQHDLNLAGAADTTRGQVSSPSQQRMTPGSGACSST